MADIQVTRELRFHNDCILEMYKDIGVLQKRMDHINKFVRNLTICILVFAFTSIISYNYKQ